MKMTIISPAFAAESEQETHETVGATGGEAHHEGGFPPFQQENFAPQIVWLIGIFGILYLLMSRVALPRVGGILENRETKIASDLEASREMQAKAQAAARANEENIRLRREEAQAIGRAVNTELGFPPYEKVAEGFGCRGLQVTRRSDLPAILTEAFGTPGTCVVNAVIDRNAGAALKSEPRARMIMFDDLASNLKNQHEFAG